MKEKFLQGWNYLSVKVGFPLMILIALTGSFFIYTIIRDWQTQHEIEQTNERLAEYDKKTNAFIENANQFLNKADVNRVATLELYNVIKEMSGNIEQLAQSDRQITVKVNSLENDYEKTRNQKRSSVNAVKPNLSVRQREDNALSADRELYPN